MLEMFNFLTLASSGCGVAKTAGGFGTAFCHPNCNSQHLVLGLKADTVRDPIALIMRAARRLASLGLLRQGQDSFKRYGVSNSWRKGESNTQAPSYGGF